jgi:uncharacterized repeat protein (TIGR04076 family)
MEILHALAEDLPKILEVQKIGYLREVERTGDQNIPAMHQTLAEIQLDFSKGQILKAVENGTMIGTVRAVLDGVTCKVGRLVVLPEHRGKGYGSALLRAIESAFPDAERYELFTASLSEDNIRLYQRQGYRTFSARPVNAKYCMVYMEKAGPASRQPLSLAVDFPGIADYAAYRNIWKRLPRLEAKMVEKNEECKHSLGDVLIFDNPYDHPAGICQALCHVFQLYLWRASVGFPSWNGQDHSVYRIHCPDAKGTVWELKALPCA